MNRNILTTTSLLVGVVAALACGGSTAVPAASTTTPDAAPQYQIVLHRPLAAGDRFRVVVDAQEKIDGDESHSGPEHAANSDIGEDLHLSLTGIVTIREVDEVGRATSALLDVEKFTASPDDKAILPTGTRVDFVRGKGDFSAMVNGEPRPELLKLLRLAFPLARPGTPLGDELFGSKEPRQVGDSWSFSKSMVARNLLEDGYHVRETDLTGDTRLQGTTSVNGVQCLELGAKLHADQATVAEQWNIQGFGTGTLDTTIKMVVPTDPKLPLAMEETTTRAASQAHAAGEGNLSQRGVTITRYRRALYTRMGKPAQ
jgi:hypothetical protein